MMRVGRRGFTLIELLVVIAIIGILAAMLFPVFARARESARKIQCLANVKNIALAVNMYLTDYDQLPPDEHRAEVVNRFVGCLPTMFEYNPYLRWPVILDEYVKNRDVWRCPSARVQGGANFIVPGPDWFGYMMAHESAWGWGTEICPVKLGTWPSGWGGDVTDSIAQGMMAGSGRGLETAQGTGAFVQSIMTNEAPWTLELKESWVDDPARFIIAGDGGVALVLASVPNWAYPDMCQMGCLCDRDATVEANWTNCPWTQNCLPTVDQMRDPNWRSKQARHLGGVNLGYMDGHAKWISSQALISASPRWPSYDAFSNAWPSGLAAAVPQDGGPLGIYPLWNPTTTPQGTDFSTACGAPPLW